MPIFLLLGGGLLLWLSSQKSNTAQGKVDYSVLRIMFGIQDVTPENQGGDYSTDFDLFFSEASAKYRVPFALLKAHAIQESSLNPRAFMDENPKGLETRKGWASRGLMQVLWWPGSERFKKYGYSDADLDGGDALFDAHVNVDIGAQIIRDNLNLCKGELRDAINMYNTGKKESDYAAPGKYTDKVYNYYLTLIGGE